MISNQFQTLFKKIYETRIARISAQRDMQPVWSAGAWGWQNEAKTKPIRGGMGAELGRFPSGFASQKTCFYMELRGLAGFELPDGGRGKITERSHRERDGWQHTGEPPTLPPSPRVLAYCHRARRANPTESK
jgi:hypothetical protein